MAGWLMVFLSPQRFSTTSPELSCFTGDSVTLRQTSKHYDGRIWKRFKHMPRHTLGISCHRPCIIKHIYLDDTLHILIALLALCCPWGPTSSMLRLAWTPNTNKPAIILAFCRSHTPDWRKKRACSLSHCEPVDSVHSEWGAPSLCHLRRAN